MINWLKEQAFLENYLKNDKVVRIDLIFDNCKMIGLLGERADAIANQSKIRKCYPCFYRWCKYFKIKEVK